MSMRTIGWVALGLVVALGVGWLIGVSGRSAAHAARQAAEGRADFLEARALVLEGRVSLYLNNFGDASSRFEEARGATERLQTRLRESGEGDRAGELEVALSHLRDAQRLASSFDAGAHNAAQQALQALQAVGATER